MKFFKNIPKKNYNTPIGDLSLVNFYAFYKKDLNNKKITTREFDNKSTLVEASINIYGDQDSLWAFLHSSNKINPFKINSENANLFLKKNENKISFGAYNISSGTFPSGITLGLPVGSILVGYTANSGESWSYNSIGNFDINGPFSIVEQTNSYTRFVTVKESKNDPTGDFIYATADNIRNYQSITKGDTYYILNNQLTNRSTKEYKESIQKEIKSDSITITDGYFSEDEVVSGNQTQIITIEEAVQKKQNILSTVSPVDIYSSLGSLIVPKYSTS